MATVGRSLPKPVYELFDGLRSYDLKRAVAQLHDEVDFEAPWQPRVTGKEAVEKAFHAWLGDPKTRPSLTVRDHAGDGAVNRLTVTQSGRFGQAPRELQFHVLCLNGFVHQFRIKDAAQAAHH